MKKEMEIMIEHNRKKIAFCTLGCKVNQYETHSIMQEFIKKGYDIVAFDEFADVYAINTCTVTNMSDKKSRQMIRKVKNINPNAIVAAIGCYAQVSKDELEKIEDIDIILGTADKKYLLEKVEIMLQNQNQKLLQVSDIMKQRTYTEFEDTTFPEKTRVEIKVQDGCDRFCSYCIIPYARGPVRSRSVESIVQEIKAVVKDKDVKEVVITGIHIASYGKDFKLDKKIGLIDLLEEINKIENIKRIRLGSLEPTIITEEFVTRLKRLEKICDHFHLSLQSGCDETLKRMNRRYTIEQFKQSVELLRKNYSNVALTTDIIVGFPGETKEEFEKTYKFLKEIKFSKMHIFKYSPRKGTKARSMPNQIDGNIKEERSNKLIELSNLDEKEFASKFINKEVQVLFEEQDENGYFKGHTSNYLVVKVKSSKDLQNEMKNVIIKSINEKNELVGI